ncbi:MAG: hypothetical protein HC894_10245 [Microcoleus sp. SM1_3_4]|nr:hypothetical protein [Microcoleus sp. SM1_3_4]
MSVSPQNPAEGSLSNSKVTFTPENWNIPQEVTVTGQPGTLMMVANRPYTIVTAPAVSNDSKYSGFNAADVSITNLFRYSSPVFPYSPGISVEPKNGLTTTEAGGTATFSVLLDSKPSSDVVIPVRSDNPAEGTVSTSSLRFTADNWNVAQTVTITGVNDNRPDGDIPYKIILDPAINNDIPDDPFFLSFSYSGIDPEDVSVTNLERNYTFSKIPTEISSYFDGRTISDWGDYNGDGKLDFIASGRSQLLTRPGSSDNFTGSWPLLNTGSTFTAESGFPRLSPGSSAVWGDYNNDGKLNFALQTIGSRFQPGSLIKLDGGVSLPNVSPNNNFNSSQSWGDYNNDGKLDLLNATAEDVPNADFSGFAFTNASVMYRYSEGNWTPDLNIQLPGVTNGAAAWADYNKDSQQDILLIGDSAGGKIAKVFRNTGSGFVEAFALPGVSNGSAAWGDYNNDRLPDILLAGNSDAGQITKVFRNTSNNGFIEDTRVVLPGSSAADWGDYDNDGKLDILLAGTNRGNRVFRNTGNGFAEDTNVLPGNVTSSFADWGDYDKDGKLDMLLDRDVYRNNSPNANTPPTAPGGLRSAVYNKQVSLGWNPAADAQTSRGGLNYNLRVGTTPGGSEIFAPMSLNDGTRQVVGLGNAGQNRSWTLQDLSPGTYYWSVQAIDTAWAGSPFATEGSFTIEPPSLINGTDGNDLLDGTSKNDEIYGLRGNDILNGVDGDDSLFGGRGNDSLYGGRGIDILKGENGNDFLQGGRNDDLLDGGLGNDNLTGGEGFDKFFLAANSGADIITDFEDGKDLLILGNGLTFAQLAIVQGNGRTRISVAATGQGIVALNGVPANQITAADFGSI